MLESTIFSTTITAPKGSTDYGAWMEKAACAGWDFKKNGDPFFPTSPSPAAAEQAITICASCPVKEACFEHSIKDRDSRKHGVYAGATPEERAVLTRRQRSNQRSKRDQGES